MDTDEIDWKERYSELESEFNEFQDESKMLEEEMEKELNETKEQLKKVNDQFLRLKNDHENSQDRLTTQVRNLQEKTAKLESSNNDLINKDLFNQSVIRKLEQSVDDLDRAKRQALATICTLENQLADELERNALLEADMDQQKELEVECQRLREQAKDLSDDLARQREKQEQIQRERREKHKSGNSMASTEISQKTSLYAQHQKGGHSKSMHLIEQSISHQEQSASPTHQPQESSTSLNTAYKLNDRPQDSVVEPQTLKDHCSTVPGKDSTSINQAPKESLHQANPNPPSENAPQEPVLEKNHQPSVSPMSNNHPSAKEFPSKISPAEKQHQPGQKSSTPLDESRRRTLKKSSSNKENEFLEDISSIPNNNNVKNKSINKQLPSSNSNSNKKHQKLSTRHSISAVNLVGDLLSKIGSLEAKISSCKQYIRDSPWKSSSSNLSKTNKYLKNSGHNHNHQISNSNVISNKYAKSPGKVRLSSELSDRDVTTPVRKSNKLSETNVGKQTQI